MKRRRYRAHPGTKLAVRWFRRAGSQRAQIRLMTRFWPFCVQVTWFRRG